MQKNIYYIGSHWIFGKGKEFVLLLIFIEVSVPSQESQDHVICFYDNFGQCGFFFIFFKWYWYIRLYKNTNVRKKLIQTIEVLFLMCVNSMMLYDR
jgi:hypothetical protein